MNRAELLAAHLECEVDGELTPIQRKDEQIDDAIGVLEQQFERGRIGQLLRLRPEHIKDLPLIQRKLLHQFGTRHVAEIDRAVALLAQSIGPELELPQHLRRA